MAFEAGSPRFCCCVIFCLPTDFGSSSCRYGVHRSCAVPFLLAYVCHPILDTDATDAVKHVEFAKSLTPSPNGKLLIHCANGHGQTGMFAAIWLLAYGVATSADDAVKVIQQTQSMPPMAINW
jgi:protein-tyrosine phosphatase